jgi:hypothetical protein
MKKLVTVLSMFVFVGIVAGCSAERHSKTTTSKTVETAPADPAVVEKRTSTHTETRTSD